MKISWIGVALLAIAVAGALGAAALGSHELSVALGGLAVGLSTKLGAIGGKPTPRDEMPPLLALLIVASLASSVTGCKPGVISDGPVDASSAEAGE